MNLVPFRSARARNAGDSRHSAELPLERPVFERLEVVNGIHIAAKCVLRTAEEHVLKISPIGDAGVICGVTLFGSARFIRRFVTSCRALW